MMDDQRQARMIASAATLTVAVVVFLLLYFNTISIASVDLDEGHKADVEMIDEEMLVEVVEPPTSGKPSTSPANAQNDEPIIQDSQAAPASGLDTHDAGVQGAAQQPVASTKPSPVKQKPEDNPVKPGSATPSSTATDSRRQANNDVANAFNRSGRNNATTSDRPATGNSGSTTGSSEASTVGSGTGSVGGGWIMPRYGSVRSNVTGVVKATVKIDRTGKVISVTITGGTPPASTNSAVKAAVEREIRSKKFSHTRPEEAEPATAYVTYIFK